MAMTLVAGSPVLAAMRAYPTLDCDQDGNSVICTCASNVESPGVNPVLRLMTYTGVPTWEADDPWYNWTGAGAGTLGNQTQNSPVYQQEYFGSYEIEMRRDTYLVCLDYDNDGETDSQSYYFADFTPVCGDEMVSETEGCDDGNLTPGDGCSDTCAVESGWTCEGEPSICSESTDWTPTELINGVHDNVTATLDDATPTFVYILLIGLGLSAAFFVYGLIKGVLKHKKQA